MSFPNFANRVPARSQNDPLAGKTTKQIFEDCVWHSLEHNTTKIFLICIARYFDPDARSSSMSYSQIARDCGLSDRKCKALAKYVVGKWLRIERNKGFYVQNAGHQNLYHGIVPSDVLEDLRQHRASWRSSTGREGVHRAHPASEQKRAGVHSVHDRGEPGAPILPLDCQPNLHPLGENQKDGCFRHLEDDDNPFTAETSAAKSAATNFPLVDGDYEKFRALANTFGRSKAEVPLNPLQRDETDLVLDGLIRPLLDQYADRIVAKALASTFGDLEALRVEESRAGSNGKGKGLTSLRRWMEPTLQDKCMKLCLHEADQGAEARAAQVVHEQRLLHRLDGVAARGRPKGGQQARSVDEIFDAAFRNTPQGE